MPALEMLYEGLGDDVSMLLITNEEKSVVEQFIQQKGYTFPVYLARGAQPAVFSSKSIPVTFVVDRSGQVVYKRTGAFDWNSQKVHKFLHKLRED